MTERKIINHISLVGIVGNILLTSFKLFAGIVGHSGAMLSDAIHSMSDIFATFIAWLGTRFSGKEADRNHPYGHERIECLAALLLGMILLATAVSIGASGVEKIVSGQYKALPLPSTIALVAALVSIVTKESMFWYTRHYAKLLNSTAFMADAWHHRSDALSSVGSLIGIGGAMLGFPILDPVACVAICLCILKVSCDILLDAARKMLDTSCPEEFEVEIRKLIISNADVLRIDRLRSRMFGSKVYIDAEIAVDGSISLHDAHSIAEQVHDSVEQSFDNIKHIMIHVNPA